MPKRAQSFCQHPGCRAIAEHGGLCEQHRSEHRIERKTEAIARLRQLPSKPRPGASKRGYNYRWQKARSAYLSQHPFCVHCQKNGLLIPALVVDHIVSHKGNYNLFWDSDNWQALCGSCHSRKTFREDVLRAR